MPILVKDFKWSQTQTDITLKVPLKGVPHSKVDILTNDDFIKVHYPPNYFELFLSQPIDALRSKCRLLENEARFTLIKRTPEFWDRLNSSIDKTENVKKKNEIIDTVQKIAQEAKQKRIEIRAEKKREEVSKEVKRDTDMQQAIEHIKKASCDEHMSKVEVLKQTEKETYRKPLLSHRALSDGRETKKSVFTRLSTPKGPPPPVKPSVRKNGSIAINFTERKFPTPQRESQEYEEGQWLQKQHEARKTIGFVEEDLRPEERNPQWLKDKGNEFYKKGNYLGALSAYSTAIRLTQSKCYDLLLNRSAAHFAVGNYKRCAEDCSAAFELLQPAVPSNLKARTACLARRGAALCKLGYLQQGYDEIVAAIKLDPQDKELQRDAEVIRCKIENGDMEMD